MTPRELSGALPKIDSPTLSGLFQNTQAGRLALVTLLEKSPKQDSIEFYRNVRTLRLKGFADHIRGLFQTTFISPGLEMSLRESLQ